MTNLIKSQGCPVCGYPDVCALDGGSPTYEICDSCGCEAGYEYDLNSDREWLLTLRRDWLQDRKGKWHCTTTKKPDNWNPVRQVRDAGLELPTGIQSPVDE